MKNTIDDALVPSTTRGNCGRPARVYYGVGAVGSFAVRFGVCVVAVATLLLAPSVSYAQPTPSPTPPASKGRTGRIDRVVAVVGATVILQSELDVRMAPVRAEAASLPDAAERKRRIAKMETQMLDELVGDELVAQAAMNAGVEVEAAEVSGAYDSVKQENNMTEEQFVAALAEQGLTPQTYRQLLRSQLLRLRAVQQFVRPKVTVTDDDVKAAYAQYSRRSDGSGAVRLAHILLTVPAGASEQQLAAAKQSAEATVTRLRAGEPFAKIASEVSNDVATKDTGGELGWFERGTLQPDWEAIVFAMTPGEVRGPVQGPNGLHVFTVLETKKGEVTPFEKVQDQIKADLIRRETDKQTATWLAELRKNAFVRTKL